MKVENPTWSNQRIADRLNVSEASVRRGLHKAGFERHLFPEDAPELQFQLDTPLELYGDAMITADWHVPLFDPVLANRMIKEAREQEIRTLVLAGDTYNMDALSSYDPKQEDAGLEREHAAGLVVLSTLLESFDRIIKIKGNHDERLARALGWKLAFKKSMHLMFGELGAEALSKIKVSNLDHCILRPYPFADDRESWYICHPKSYSRMPMVGARALTAKVGMNVITAHSHHCGITAGIARNSIAIEAGGLFDATKTGYLQSSTTFPHWSQGYCYIKNDNKPVVRSPLWSAW